VINPTRLETFLNAAEYLSFSEAARHMHLSQPTVSHHIKMLEKELAVDLFIRSGSGLKLTEGGRLLLPWARKVLQDAIELKEMMAALQDGIAGNLRIACSTTAGKYVLPQLAARFSRRYPGVRVTIMRCMTDLVITNLLDYDANLGVVSSEARKDNIEMQEFFRDSITLIVPQDHPFALKREIKPGDLIGEPIIMREPTSGTRRAVLSELAKHDISIDDLNIFMQLGNAEAIVRTVAAGYGISFVSESAIDCPLKAGYIAAVTVEDLNLKRKIYMLRKRLDKPCRPQEAFWSFVHDPSNQDLLKVRNTAR
jgi:DNA-binding transcriptional LysR family regulator